MPKVFSSTKIHTLKEETGFDVALLRLLVPAGHSSYSSLKVEELADLYLGALKLAVNPAVCDFFTKGYRKVIADLHRRRTVPVTVRYRLSNEVRKFLHDFVGVAYAAVGLEIQKTQKRELNEHIVLVVEEAIRHSRLVKVLRRR